MSPVEVYFYSAFLSGADMLSVGTRICVSSNVKGREVVDEENYLTIGKSSPCSLALCLAMS